MSIALAPKFDPSRRCRPVALWPPADRRAWELALQPGDVLEPGSPASRWAAATTSGVIKSYGRWLTWLDSTQPLDPSLPAAASVTPERVRDFIAALDAVNAPKTVLHRVVGLAQAAGALAPDRDWTWLWDIVTRLQRTAHPIRLKRQRVVGSDELFALGRQIMQEADCGAGPAWRQAADYRDGLMIALLAARPLRIKNFTAIEIGRHLVIEGAHCELRFVAAETKTYKPLEQPFPEALRPALDRYLACHRPILLARQHKGAPSPGRALWLSKEGRPMSRNGIYGRIVELTQARLGRRINPHLFRDCAATSIAIEDPAHVAITASVLGHAGLATSERSYNHAHMLQAARRYQAEITALRRG